MKAVVRVDCLPREQRTAIREKDRKRYRDGIRSDNA